MPIRFNPNVGEVLVCDFGDDYPRTPTGEPDTSTLTVNNRLPPEMVKKRLVVVLNGKMTGGCMVVPISASEKRDLSKTTTKFHIPIPGVLIQGHDYFTSDVERRALGEQVQQVSKRRLTTFHADPSMNLILPSELVTKIQRSVIKAIKASRLLVPDVASDTPQGSTATPVAPVPSNALGMAMFTAQTKKTAV